MGTGTTTAAANVGAVWWYGIAYTTVTVAVSLWGDGTLMVEIVAR